jgi:uncharacterized 2Fe-2S/4Fe-4S cluster protein (DUF4445 family)
MPTITFQPNNVTVSAAPGTLLWEAARAAGLSVETPCGGRGVCGKCLARVEAGKVEFEDTSVMPRGMAREGYVLICRAKVSDAPAIVRLTAQLEREKGQFAGDGDRALVDPSLFPASGDIEPLARTLRLDVAPPTVGDGLSDCDRLERAVKTALNVPRVALPLPLLRKLPGALRQDEGSVTVAYSLGEGAAHIAGVSAGGAAHGNCGVAVDIGTTTIAVQLIDMGTGRALASKTAYNAQIECGLDVISRINYARKPERLEELRTKALGTINGLISDLAAACGVGTEDIYAASLAGNTTMAHLLLGIPPEYIRLEPYTPAVYRVPELCAGDIGLGIAPEAVVRVAPAVGSYVGGDITSGLLCTGLSTNSDEVCLFIDIGTNGELVLGNGEFLMGCACSAGPAFEGGGLDCGMRASQGAVEWAEVDKATGLPTCSVIGGGKPAGICGSGMIALLANLFEAGWLDAAGKLDRSRPCEAIETAGRQARYVLARAQESAAGRDVYVTENDIGNIVRAKAAIFSACRVMLRKIGMDFGDLSTMYIAGGFGRYLDADRARTIGLMPALPQEKLKFIGNSSLTGAYMTLVSERHRQKQDELAAKITYLDLSVEPEYMDEYTAALFLPHTEITLFR